MGDDIIVCPMCGSLHVERTADGWSVGCDCAWLRSFTRDDMGKAFEAFARNRRSVGECSYPTRCAECANAPGCRPEMCVYTRVRRWSRRRARGAT